MKSKILIAALACASAAVFAQSSAPVTSNAKETKPRDLATGQASGKIVSQPAGSNASLNSSSSDKVTAPRDIATGQASGKRQYHPVIIRKVTDEDAAPSKGPQASGSQSNRESSAASVSEIVVTKPSASKTTAQDDWQTPARTQTTQTSDGSTNQWPSKVATGDVNGDGHADAAINNSHSNIKNSKDLATGQASGKRQHNPVTFQKEVGTTSPSK